MAFRGKQVQSATAAQRNSSPRPTRRATAAACGSPLVPPTSGSTASNDVDASGSKGRKVKAGAVVAIDLAPGSELYARTASGSAVCDLGIEGVD